MANNFLLGLGAALLLAILASCTTTGEPTENISEYSEEEQRLIIRAKKEMEIGRNMAGRLLRFYGVHNDQEMVRYVNEVGNFVVQNSSYPDRRFMFDILDSEEVNAYACPGGYILITLGAIRKAASEAELAAILAHEVSHVGREHMLTKLANMSDEELKGKKEEEKNLPASMLVRKRPEAKESAAGAMLAKYVGGSVAGLNALAAAKAGMSIIMEKGLGAELEFEADADGSKYILDSGYHPLALANYLCRVYVSKGFKKSDCRKSKAKKINKKKQTILDKTHPSVPQRIANIRSYLRKYDVKDVVGAKGKKRILQMRKRLPKPSKTKDS